MATETQTLKLDLDTKDFLAKSEQADDAIAKIGEPSKLESLREGLTTAGKLLGVVGSAALAAKASLDLVLEAESVRSVNQQFEILTKNAGISGEALKSALMGVADGLVDDTDLLKAASEQVVRLGANAEKLPEVFSLARDVTRAFGGDLLENFDRLSTAIASGNTRSLKQLGLIVDQDKAMRDYAKTLGVTVDALTEQEQRQAMLEATLQKGRVAFAGVDDSVRSTTLAWQQLKVALQGIAETATLAFERLAGPIVRAELGGLNDIAKDVSRWFKDKFGEGPEQAAAHMERLQEQITETGGALVDAQIKVEELGKRYGSSAKYMTEYNDAVRDMLGLEKDLASLREEAKAAPAVAERSPAVAGGGAETPEADQAVNEKRLAVASKFENDLLNLRMARINQEISTATTVEQVETLQAERKQAMLDQLAAKEQQVAAQVAAQQMTQAQANATLMEYRAASQADLRKVEQQYERERLQALENFAQASAKTAQGFAAGFKSAAAQAAQDATNFSKMGQMAFSSLQKNATQAFLDLGSGSKKSSEVMKSFMLNALADMAQAQGALMLAMITNPAAMAAGAGLLVLAGILRSKAGGGGGAGEAIGAQPSGGSAEGFTSSGGGGSMASAQDRPALEEARRKREVQLVVQGSYFETEQTKRTLMEMIRSETDATGFSYTQIGQGV